MSWIKTIDYQSAGKKLKDIYNRISGPQGNIDNVLLIHSLRPHTLTGHMSLYKSVLHHQANELPCWYLEALGVYVSNLNGCSYCVDHHMAGLKRIIGSDFNAIWESLSTENFTSYFNAKESAGLSYAKSLTLRIQESHPDWVQSMKDGGFNDGEILEINQVVSYFNYVNRVVLGLGVTTEGDILGLSPNNGDDPDNWTHK